MSQPDAGVASALVAAYERLRTAVLAGTRSRDSPGLLVFLREGTAALLAATRVSGATDAAVPVDPKGPTALNDVQTDLVGVLANILMTDRKEIPWTTRATKKSPQAI